jgi:hypothetical protein
MRKPRRSDSDGRIEVTELLRGSEFKLYAKSDSAGIVVRRWIAKLATNPPAGIHPTNVSVVEFDMRSLLRGASILYRQRS